MTRHNCSEWDATGLLLEPRVEAFPVCPDCGGSGESGQTVTREMAVGAGDPSLEGVPFGTCSTCRGFGGVRP